MVHYVMGMFWVKLKVLYSNEEQRITTDEVSNTITVRDMDTIYKENTDKSSIILNNFYLQRKLPIPKELNSFWHPMTRL